MGPHLRILPESPPDSKEEKKAGFKHVCKFCRITCILDFQQYNYALPHVEQLLDDTTNQTEKP